MGVLELLLSLPMVAIALILLLHGQLSNNMANSSFTKSSINTPVAVADGGTGAATFTDAGVLIGNSTGAVQVTNAATSGQVLTTNGAGLDPTIQAAGGRATIPTTKFLHIFDVSARYSSREYCLLKMQYCLLRKLIHPKQSEMLLQKTLYSTFLTLTYT